MARSDMSDLEWEFIKAVLPNKTRGKKRVDDRRVINGIFYVLRTGIPWADLPEQYGPPTTVYNRFNRWSYAGHWDRIMDAIADALCRGDIEESRLFRPFILCSKSFSPIAQGLSQRRGGQA